ncbi:MAG: hydantoinase/oxoprolinase family protein [Mariniblastus sp.]
MKGSDSVFAGLDIGGANVKFATCSGLLNEVEFPIWQNKEGLGAILQQFADQLPPEACVGITMTAELADCFQTKLEGVRFVVESAVKAFANKRALVFYQTDGRLCDADYAIGNWKSTAASNWHATAWLAFSKFANTEAEHRSGFVFDIGSTTTDIIPVRDGKPVVENQMDLHRLSNGQLFYAGVGRTPICSLLNSVKFDFGSVSIARELFATTRDACIWLGDVQENLECNATADGRPASRLCAGYRLGRMVCADRDELYNECLNQVASQAKHALVQQLAENLKKVIANNPGLPLVFKTFGGGAWLVPEVVEEAALGCNVSIFAFSDDETVNQTAPAFAVAQRCREHFLERETTDG